jgi:hypothetical protein
MLNDDLFSRTGAWAFEKALFIAQKALLKTEGRYTEPEDGRFRLHRTVFFVYC